MILTESRLETASPCHHEILQASWLAATKSNALSGLAKMVSAGPLSRLNTGVCGPSWQSPAERLRAAMLDCQELLPSLLKSQQGSSVHPSLAAANRSDWHTMRSQAHLMSLKLDLWNAWELQLVSQKRNLKAYLESQRTQHARRPGRALAGVSG